MGKSYSIKELSEVVEGVFTGANPEARVSHLLLDSRKLSFIENTLFFALNGMHHDGHKYVRELYDKGVRNFVVSRLPENRFLLEEANFIIVKNTLTALQNVAGYHKSHFGIPTIGITGSNGKTIVKEWLFQLLKSDFEIVRSPKSYNSQVGVPLSVWQISEEHQLALFEAGISMIGEMEKLEPIIQPSVGVFTNIGHAHGQHFDAQQTKVSEKLNLFRNCSKLVYCLDHKIIHDSILARKDLEHVELITWSKYHDATVRIISIQKARKMTNLRLKYQDDEFELIVPFTDEASLENIMHCICVSLEFNVGADQLAESIAKLLPLAMRLELKEGVNNCALINDSYSSDLESLQIALEFMGQQQLYKKKTVILSDIPESARNQVDVYEDVAMLLKRNGVDMLIGIGPQLKKYQGLFPLECAFYKSTADFINNIANLEFKEETILIKGARTFAFEQIVQLLEQKAHQTVLEIDLNALVHNLNLYRSLINPETKIMVMVKAFSYGSGSYEIANVLQFHRVDYLGVAFADEGVELRKAGIQLPIMVMNPDESSFDLMVRYQLEPEIYSIRALDLFEHAIAIKDKKEKFKLHIKLDTGMHRLGFLEEDLPELIGRLKDHPKLKVQSVFSHLATAASEEHKAFSQEQLEQFDKLSSQVMLALGDDIDRHVLNSAGIEFFPDSQYDMVRLGIGIYGVGGLDNLMTVSTLKTTISQIKHLKKGQSIGYGRSFVAEKDIIAGTLPIGYADGLNRKLGNGRGILTVNGAPVPIIGDVCMDMCFINITDVDAKEGDEVVIFGPENTIEDLADKIGTIPYEVLTSISRRVKRVYFQE